MNKNKIVARFNDGRVMKGFTDNLNPDLPYFMLSPAGGQGKPVAIDILQLKAIFFVRDFAGSRLRKDRSNFAEKQEYQGRRIEVQFKDGEKFIGSTACYGPEMRGFFIFPADTESNTIKVFAVAGSVKSVRWLN